MIRTGFVLLLGAVAVFAFPVGQATGGPELAGVVANPVAHGDRGEFLVVSVPADTDLSALSIHDGEGVARFPNRTASGRFAVSTTPDAVDLEIPVLRLRGDLQLANSGETIRLRVRNETVDTVSYDRAPEGERYEPTPDGWVWRPRGATDRPVVTASNVSVDTFVLPDTPSVPIEHLRAATDRILLAGYTLTSRRVVRTLCAASERGLTVRALLEGQPVGGLTDRGAARLDRLATCGVSVSVLGGEPARYSFHHAKYAVVDDAAIVMTENWKPSGTGGRSSRGWGGVVESRAIAEGLAKTFEADAGFRDAVPWRQFRNRTSVVAAPPVPRAEFPTRFESASLTADRVAVLAAPDNAAERIVEELDAATTRIRVEQISIGSRHHPFVRALLAAAERGVSVKVLLGSAFYVREENRELADWLNERARREGLPLEAKLAAPRSRFEKIHAKGIVIDQRVVLGSINWTNESIRRNREVALLIDDPAAARYFTRVFRADWRGGRWSVPAGLLAVALAVSAVAAYGTRSLRFGTDHSVSPDAAIDP